MSIHSRHTAISSFNLVTSLMCLYVLMRSTESLRRGAEAGSRNCLGILDCIVCRSDDDPAADDPPKESEELAVNYY